MTLEEAKPIRGYLLVEPEESGVKKKAEGLGIYLSDTIKIDRPQTGIVLKVGGELKTEYGAVIDSPVSVNEKIIFKKWGGNEIKIEEKEYFLIRFDDVIGTC
jgi:chaperonin GroES